MSKWQLPTQKGTELFPQTTRPPVAVRFEGVPPGSPLARELGAAFRGQIGQFYMQQAQSYALGIVDQRGGRRSTPELEMSYSNNQGSEIIRVKVAKHVIEAFAVRQAGRLWDYALIELTIDPDGGEFAAPDMVAAAVMRVPGIGEITAATPIPHNGVAAYPTLGGEPDKVINMARPNWVDHSSADYIGRIASWTVDMSGLGTIPEVGVDVYASIVEYVQDAGSPQFVRAAGPLVVSGPPTSYAGPTPLTTKPPEIEPGFNGYPSATSLFPVYFNGATSRYEFTMNDDIITGWQYTGAHYNGLIPNLISPGTHGYVTITYDAAGARVDTLPYEIEDMIRPGDDHGYPASTGSYSVVDQWATFQVYTPVGPVDTYDGPDPAPADMQVTMFPYAREFRVGKYSTAYRWDYPQWPQRPGHLSLSGASVGVVEVREVPSGDLLLPVVQKLRHVGTVMLDRRRGGAALINRG